MAWTGQIVTDANSPNVGVATAIWNIGETDEFRYSRRARMTVEEGQAILAEAEAARQTAIAKAQADAALSATFTNILNGV